MHRTHDPPPNRRFTIDFGTPQGKVNGVMSDTEQTDTPSEAQTEPKPRSRGGRRRGGRGRGRKTANLEQAANAPEPLITDGEHAGSPAVEAIEPGPGPDSPKTPSPRPPSRPQEPQRPGGNNRQAIHAAQRHIQQVIESLQQALEEMEQAQRLLDQVDRERGEDLRELEALRRSLNQLQSSRADFRPRPGRGSGRS